MNGREADFDLQGLRPVPVPVPVPVGLWFKLVFTLGLLA